MGNYIVPFGSVFLYVSLVSLIFIVFVCKLFNFLLLMFQDLLKFACNYTCTMTHHYMYVTYVYVVDMRGQYIPYISAELHTLLQILISRLFLLKLVLTVYLKNHISFSRKKFFAKMGYFVLK